jgi:hypothetical protein
MLAFSATAQDLSLFPLNKQLGSLPFCFGVENDFFDLMKLY